MINLRIKDQTILLVPVRVTPKSSMDRLMPYKATDEWLQIKVTSPPEDGKANQAVLEVLAKAIDVPKRSIQLLSGEHSRLKVFGLQIDQSNDEIIQKLSTAIQVESSKVFQLTG